jgi:hypothetical protein
LLKPLRNMTTTVKPANLTVCRVVHVVPSSPARQRPAPSSLP